MTDIGLTLVGTFVWVVGDVPMGLGVTVGNADHNHVLEVDLDDLYIHLQRRNNGKGGYLYRPPQVTDSPHRIGKAMISRAIFSVVVNLRLNSTVDDSPRR
ncbi:MAG: hypothetical protein IPH85_05585 [Ignavibacteria bacterium]|nr:hypothetical protein [Ignavibacteria bacterium]